MKKLEAYRAFPFIAWFLVLGFAFYVFSLTLTIEDEHSVLTEKTDTTQNALNES